MENNTTLAENTHKCPVCGHECIGERQMVLTDSENKRTLHYLQCFIKKMRSDIPELDII